jgi:hypothetical protein
MKQLIKHGSEITTSYSQLIELQDHMETQLERFQVMIGMIKKPNIQ